MLKNLSGRASNLYEETGRWQMRVKEVRRGRCGENRGWARRAQNCCRHLSGCRVWMNKPAAESHAPEEAEADQAELWGQACQSSWTENHSRQRGECCVPAVARIGKRDNRAEFLNNAVLCIRENVKLWCLDWPCPMCFLSWLPGRLPQGPIKVDECQWKRTCRETEIHKP